MCARISLAINILFNGFIMKKVFYFLCAASALGACSNGSSGVTTVAPPTITAINTGPLNGDFNQGLFSTYINFKSNETINNWQFGFYVARTFYKYIDPDTAESQNSANTEMTMQICQMPAGSPCAPLQYLKTQSVTQNDSSAGYTNILGIESGTFPLIAGQNYQVQIINSNQWSINNLSSAPQSLFFVVNGQVLNTPTESSIYNLNINEQTNQAQIDSFNQLNWTTNTNLNSESSIIVPAPVNYALGSGNFALSSGMIIHNSLSNDNTVATFLQQDLAKDLNISTSIDNSSSADNGIIIKTITNPSDINNNPEGYQIIIGTNKITINAMTNAGAFYALQTLRQLWNVNQGTIAQATITDYPRFSYRGILLDSSRHFFSVAEVESLIDIASTHKLNTLHWHLSDDEGTRLDVGLGNVFDSRGYGQSMNGMLFIQANLDPTNYLNQMYANVNSKYSGSYSNNDLQSIIKYANARNVVIIPEVDSPGHARALVKAFPKMLVDPNDHSQYFTNQGYTDDALPVCTYDTNITVGPQFTQGYNKLYNNLNKLFSGQTPLNPANFIPNEISVGGDEVADQTWYTPQDLSCEQNVEFALLNSLEKEHLFFKKFAAKNPNLIISGWQQFIQSNGNNLGLNIVPPNQVGHVWIWNESAGGVAQAVTLAQAGYPVVLDYSNDTYFDLAYTQSIYEPGFYWAGYNNTYSALRSAVDATATINAIQVGSQGNIKGLEGTLWSENMPTYQHLMYMAVPKMSGLAEAAWSAQTTTSGSGATAAYPNWQSLANRLGCGNLTAAGHYQGFLSYLYKIYGIHYRGYPNGINLEAPQACNVQPI